VEHSAARRYLGRLLYEDGGYDEARYWLERSTDRWAGEFLERMKAEGRI
jgi:hypothetical protein